MATKIDFPFQYNRNEAIPLKNDEVFDSINDLNDYIANKNNRYAGQLFSVKGEGETPDLYILNNDRDSASLVGKGGDFDAVLENVDLDDIKVLGTYLCKNVYSSLDLDSDILSGIFGILIIKPAPGFNITQELLTPSTSIARKSTQNSPFWTEWQQSFNIDVSWNNIENKPDLSVYVLKTQKVNNKALSGNIEITPQDIPTGLGASLDNLQKWMLNHNHPAQELPFLYQQLESGLFLIEPNDKRRIFEIKDGYYFTNNKYNKGYAMCFISCCFTKVKFIGSYNSVSMDILGIMPPVVNDTPITLVSSYLTNGEDKRTYAIINADTQQLEVHNLHPDEDKLYISGWVMCNADE
jgi:hypothetical protein